MAKIEVYEHGFLVEGMATRGKQTSLQIYHFVRLEMNGESGEIGDIKDKRLYLSHQITAPRSRHPKPARGSEVIVPLPERIQMVIPNFRGLELALIRLHQDQGYPEAKAYDKSRRYLNSARSRTK